jgi:hypothetical protein
MELDNGGLFMDSDFEKLLGAGVLTPRTMLSVLDCKDPAEMNAVEFLMWLDTATVEELESFGNRSREEWQTGGGYYAVDAYYDVITRTTFYVPRR